MTGTEELEISTMSRADLGLALDWAAAEGWNPGLGDADAFHAADPEGFLMGRLGDRPVACISVVRYGAAFGFLGLYIVQPEYRGRGHGWRIWQEGMSRLGGRNVGLDGVKAQQDNYRKSGFVYAYGNVRYEGLASGKSQLIDRKGERNAVLCIGICNVAGLVPFVIAAFKAPGGVAGALG